MSKHTSETQSATPATNENPIGTFLRTIGCPDNQVTDASDHLLTVVTHLKTVAGKIDGNKKDSADYLREVFDLKGNCAYKTIINHLDDDTTGVLRMANPVPWDEWTWMHNLLEVVEDDIEDDIEDEVVEDEAPTVSIESMITSLEATVKRSIKSLRDSVNVRMDSLESMIDDMESVVASIPAPTPARTPSLMDVEPTPTKVEVVEDDEPEVVTTGDRKVKKLWHSKEWKNGTNYVCGVVCDTITEGYSVRLAFGQTSDEARESGRKIALRSILNANGWNIQGDDWFAKAATKGVTMSVIDSFMTNPVKHMQTAGRSANTLVGKLGVTTLGEYKVAAKAAVEGGNTTPTPARTETSEIATVDPAEVKEVMSDMGMTYREAKAFLTE